MARRLALASLTLLLALVPAATAAAAPLPLKRYNLSAEVRVTHDWTVSGTNCDPTGSGRVAYTLRSRKPAKLRIGYWAQARSWVIGTLRSFGSQQIPEPFDALSLRGDLVMSDDTVPSPSGDGSACNDLVKHDCGSRRASGSAGIAPIRGKRVRLSLSVGPDLAEGLSPRDCLIGDFGDAFRFPASRRIAEEFSKSLSTGVLRRVSFSIRAEDSYTFRGRRNDLPLETHTHRSVRLTFKRP